MSDEQKPQQQVTGLQALVTIGVVGGLIWFFVGGGLERQTAKEMSRVNAQAAIEMNRIEAQVAQDAVKQYEIAKRNGTAMDRCVQAGMVTAAFLQANDEANYSAWKRTEEADCRAAGLPR